MSPTGPEGWSRSSACLRTSTGSPNSWRPASTCDPRDNRSLSTAPPSTALQPRPKVIQERWQAVPEVVGTAVRNVVIIGSGHAQLGDRAPPRCTARLQSARHDRCIAQTDARRTGAATCHGRRTRLAHHRAQCAAGPVRCQRHPGPHPTHHPNRHRHPQPPKDQPQPRSVSGRNPPPTVRQGCYTSGRLEALGRST